MTTRPEPTVRRVAKLLERLRRRSGEDYPDLRHRRYLWGCGDQAVEVDLLVASKRTFERAIAAGVVDPTRWAVLRYGPLRIGVRAYW